MKKYKVILGCILGCVVLIVCFALIYTFMGRFDKRQDSIDRIVLNEIMTVNNTEIKLKLNEEELSHLLTRQIEGKEMQLEIEDLWVDLPTSSIQVNTKYLGIPLPISAKVNVSLNMNEIHFEFSKLSWGNWHVPLPMFQNRFNQYMTELNYNKITREDLNLPDFIEIRRIKILENEIELTLGIIDEKIHIVFKEFFEDIDEEIVTLFSQSDELEKRWIYEFLKEGRLTEEAIEELVESYLEEQNLVKLFFMSLTNDRIEKIFKEYGTYIKGIDKNLLYEIKAELLVEQRLKSCELLLEAFDLYERDKLKKPFLYYGSIPYDLDRDEIITPELLTKYFGLPITEGFLKDTHLIVDNESKNPIITHYLNDNRVLVYKKDHMEVLSKDIYEQNYGTYQMLEREMLIVEDKERRLIEEAILNYWRTDKIFTRYLASDYQYAFVIASHGYNFQTFSNFVLEKKEGNWSIIQVDIKDYYQLNEEIHTFNVTLLPKTLAGASLLTKLSHNDRIKIIEDLYTRKIIDNKNINQLEYFSYSGQYIAIKLSDGREYIYSVSFGFLESLLPREDALQQFRGIPDIILLQG